MKLLLIGSILIISCCIFYVLFLTRFVDNVIAKFKLKSGEDIKSELENIEKTAKKISQENEKQKQKLQEDNEVLSSFEIKQKTKRTKKTI